MAGAVRKVLVANRGEIAVRVIRTCRDMDIASVAVYADQDRSALHAVLADEAYALDGSTAAETYLMIEKILEVAQRSEADAIHPGYGFLSENPEFAQAVMDAGLTWIGPPPDAIRALGDKVSARRIAEQAGAPLVPGTPQIDSADDVVAFADAHGLPVAIKAAHGGGGRGLKVARTRDEIPELYDSAVREATAAFGRGECFVERYLDRPRHVETQCLADQHGTVVVVSTRDCSLQRRHQKLVEEAPAPFLSPEQERALEEGSRRILREAGYVGAGTCEFLVGQDGTISFLEVNTRLQVEHPVSEEITGLDLVQEQIRIARGEPLGYDRVEHRGHSIELRINGEDPANSFLPAPGTIRRIIWPSGPGVRLDAGVRPGATVSGAFDSLIAKIIITGQNRQQALARARRALEELEIEGMKTVVPFHRAVLQAPDFTAERARDFRVHTTWIETDFAAELGQLDSPAVVEGPAEEPATHRIVVEVGGKRLEVVLPAGIGMAHAPGQPSTRAPRGPRRRRATPTNPSTGALTAPMQGTIVKCAVEDGQSVAEGDVVVVLEAMKMEQPLVAHRSGVIAALAAEVGATVSAGTVLCEIR